MRLFSRLWVLGIITGLAACGTSQPTKFYLLSASAPGVPVTTASELTIGLGPVVLPPYLERREMVSRSSGNELNLATYHQWAEPLRDNVTRVIGEDLGRRLGSERIMPLPIKRSLRKALPVDYQVGITVETFEKAPDGGVVLSAQWTILDGDKNVRLLRRSEYRETPDTQDYAGQAAAQSRALGRLSDEIAAAISALERSDGR